MDGMDDRWAHPVAKVLPGTVQLRRLYPDMMVSEIWDFDLLLGHSNPYQSCTSPGFCSTGFERCCTDRVRAGLRYRINVLLSSRAILFWRGYSLGMRYNVVSRFAMRTSAGLTTYLLLRVRHVPQPWRTFSGGDGPNTTHFAKTSRSKILTRKENIYDIRKVEKSSHSTVLITSTIPSLFVRCPGTRWL